VAAVRQKHLVLILAREFSSQLAMPTFIESPAPTAMLAKVHLKFSMGGRRRSRSASANRASCSKTSIVRAA